MSLWGWLGFGDRVIERDVPGVVEIERALTGLDPARARYLACFAYILTRSARADYTITDAEAREMERLVAERGGIPSEQAAKVVEIARIHALREGGTDDFLVTRYFSDIATRDEKRALLDCLFAVSGVDESIVTAEENEIRRIAAELKLEHADYIEIRASYLRQLEVLRKRDVGSR